MATFSDVNSLGGATAAIFTAPTAQRLVGKQGYDEIAIAGRGGVPASRLASEIKPMLPSGAQIKTGSQQAAADGKDVSSFLRFIRMFLLSFGGIALFVGAFVIFNTLSITVAQRTRELATLRTLGASRPQVLRSVMLETLVVGLGASVVGLGAGVALAKGLSSLLDAFGLSLPQTATVFATRTAVIALSVGTVVTMAAGLIPAVRATRVAPIAAVREGALVPEGARGHGRRVGVVSAIVGSGLLAAGAAGHGGLLVLAAGALLLFVGVGATATALVPVLAGIAGRPGEFAGGFAARLATRNAIRNRSRTASTAAALMIGLALVTFVAVLAQGLRGSDKAAIVKQLTADYVVQAADGNATFPTTTEHALAGLGGRVAAVRYDRALVGRSTVDVNGVDANVAEAMLAASHPDRPQHAQLAGALEHREHQRVDHPEHADQHRQGQQHVHQSAQVRTRSQFIADRSAWLGKMLNQARRMVRHESVITALIGAAIGLPLGLGLGWVVIRRIGGGLSYHLPVGSLMAFVIVAIAVGIAAAVLPARRVSRLVVLSALQYE